MSYDELLQRLANDLPSVMSGFVPSSLSGSSGSVPAPSAKSTLLWDTSEQLYVPGQLTSDAVVGNWVSYTPNVTANSGSISSATWNAKYLVLTTHLLVIQFNINLVNVGTAAGDMLIPFPTGYSTAATAPGVARETAVTGKFAECYGSGSLCHIYSTTIDGAPMWTNGYDWQFVLTLPI